VERAEASVGPNLVIERTVRDVSEIVRGKPEAVRLCILGLLARGHVLLEDVPGVGKTTLARALAQSVGGDFGRIQMTADLLPADIVGGPMLDRSSGELVFRPGPVFANVVLADELNRATPRTQSGLLEAMAERSVSVDGKTYRLPEPFFVVATQNPSDHHGVYRLPQSQLDRFLLRTSLGYPDEATELELLLGKAGEGATEPRLTQEVLAKLHAAVDEVRLEASVAKYLRAIAERTRGHGELEIGVSTRGLLALGQASRARALMDGRDFVSPDDVRALAVPVLAHRVVLGGGRANEREEAEAILDELAGSVEPPV